MCTPRVEARVEWSLHQFAEAQADGSNAEQARDYSA